MRMSEEIRLIKEAFSGVSGGGDVDEVGERLLAAAGGLVAVIVNRYRGRRAPVEDLYSAGLEALWRAFITWDPDRAAFSTWATRWIVGAVSREATRLERGHLTYSGDLKRKEALRVAEELRQAHGREPTVAEVAAEIGVSEERLRDVFSVSQPLEDAEILPAAAAGDEGLEEAAWWRTLAAGTVDLDPTTLWAVLSRSGLFFEPVPYSYISAVVGEGRETLRRRVVKAQTRRQARIVEA